MARWSGAATVAIRQKIGVIAERITKALDEKYGRCYKLGRGLYDDLMWLGFLNETSTRHGWTHPRDAVENMKEIIREKLIEGGEEPTNEELEALLYPILQDFFSFVFNQAKICNFKPPSSYENLYNFLSLD